MFDTRKTRQRANTLNTVKAAIDSAKSALTAGDIAAHDEAMDTVTSFLAAYAKFPALTHIDAPAAVVDTPLGIDAPFLGDDEEAGAAMTARDPKKK